MKCFEIELSGEKVLCRMGQSCRENVAVLAAMLGDALSSKLLYHDPVSPSGAMDYLLANAGAEFDPDLVELMSQKIAIFHAAP